MDTPISRNAAPPLLSYATGFTMPADWTGVAYYRFLPQRRWRVLLRFAGMMFAVNFILGGAIPMLVLWTVHEDPVAILGLGVITAISLGIFVIVAVASIFPKLKSFRVAIADQGLVRIFPGHPPLCYRWEELKIVVDIGFEMHLGGTHRLQCIGLSDGLEDYPAIRSAIYSHFPSLRRVSFLAGAARIAGHDLAFMALLTLSAWIAGVNGSISVLLSCLLISGGTTFQLLLDSFRASNASKFAKAASCIVGLFPVFILAKLIALFAGVMP